MTQRSLVSDTTARSGDVPSPDITAFIRYCHQRRGAAWPELYDEMCGVAARREFNGWDHEALAARGLTFSLFEMPRLAAWSRAVQASLDEQGQRKTNQGSGTPRLKPHSAVA